MKKLNRIITFLIIAIMYCGMFACNGGGGNNSLTVKVLDLGYGYAWAEEMAIAFEEETGVSVIVNPVYDASSEVSLLQGGSNKADIIFLVQDNSMLAEDGNLADLTEILYKKRPYGKETGKTVEELSAYSKALNIDGKYYSVSYASGRVSLLYNADTLDTVFGSGNWTLPRTTDEWVTMMDDINVYENAVPLISAGNYMEYITMTWWAQYDGEEKFFDYWRGYQDGAFCSDDPTFAKTQGRLEAVNMLETVFKSSNGYTHPNTGTFFADGEPFKNGQKIFIGEYAQDDSLVAFYPCGDWYENEMGSYFEGHNVKMMKTPVISSIVNTFTDTADKGMSDDNLAAVIEKIDQGIEYSANEYGCAQSTYDKIFEARNMVCTNGELQQAVVPVTSKKQEQAADFLRFMISEQGQSIYAQKMGGLHMGYGYDPSNDSEVEVSDFVKSVSDCFENENTICIYRDISQTLSYRGGLAAFTTNLNKYTQVIFTGNCTGEYVYNDTYNELKTNWATYKNDAGLN